MDVSHGSFHHPPEILVRPQMQLEVPCGFQQEIHLPDDGRCHQTALQAGKSTRNGAFNRKITYKKPFFFSVL